MPAVAWVIIVVLFAALAVAGFFVVHKTREVRAYLAREEELKRKVLQVSILKSLTERIGYTLDVSEIIEIISGSLEELVPYSTVGYLLFDRDAHRLVVKVTARVPVDKHFIEDVRGKMLDSFTALRGDEAIRELPMEEKITGVEREVNSATPLASFFNLPFIVGGEALGLINVASREPGRYTAKETEVLYEVTALASTTVHRLSQVLENENRKHNAMVASLSSGIVMVDQDEKVVVANPEAKLLLGFGDRINLRADDLASRLPGMPLFDVVSEALKTGAPVMKSDIGISGRFFTVTVSAVVDARGEKLGWVALFYDMSKEKELARLRDEFTAMIVHELRTPLTTIRWALERMRMEKRIAKSIATALPRATDATESILLLVNNLLDVAKLEAGKFGIAPQPDDLVKLVKETVKLFVYRAEIKNLVLEARVSSEIPIFSFDRERISQVLGNFISNALKFTPAGSITVTAGLRGDRARVEVSDTGLGIPEDAQQKLFQRFSQAGIASLRREGTGLGLVIAKGIVEQHGGTIGFTSKEGEGSVFWFELPLSGPAV